MRKKIIMTGTGGHFTAALATFEVLQGEGWEIHWVGASSAFEKIRRLSWEAEILPKLKVPFWPIKTGKIQRGRPWETFLSLLRFPLGFLQSLWVVGKIRPAAVLSFGGFVSIPVSFSAWLMKVPVVVHEQTAASGLANRLVAKIARKVAISTKLSAADFPQDKVVVTGNPVRKAIWEIAEHRKPHFAELSSASRGKRKVVIYITGGSRGSQVINQAVFEGLPRLLELGIVYHQTGPFDFEKAESRKQKAEKDHTKNYTPKENFLPGEVEEIYKRADLVIGRAGANTVSELEVLQIPAVLVPIPWAERNEQEKNAKILERKGQAVILRQRDLAGKSLLEKVKEALKLEEKKKTEVLARKDAAKKLAQIIDEVSKK